MIYRDGHEEDGLMPLAPRFGVMLPRFALHTLLTLCKEETAGMPQGAVERWILITGMFGRPSYKLDHLHPKCARLVVLALVSLQARRRPLDTL